MYLLRCTFNFKSETPRQADFYLQNSRISAIQERYFGSDKGEIQAIRPMITDPNKYDPNNYIICEIEHKNKLAELYLALIDCGANRTCCSPKTYKQIVSTRGAKRTRKYVGASEYALDCAENYINFDVKIGQWTLKLSNVVVLEGLPDFQIIIGMSDLEKYNE